MLLLLLLTATFSLSLPLSLYFGCQLVLTFFPTGNQPPCLLVTSSFFFFLPCCLTSFTLIVSLPRQSPAAAPVREPVCLLIGRRRLPLGDCIALQLVQRSDANEPPGAPRQASARTSQLAQHFFLHSILT